MSIRTSEKLFKIEIAWKLKNKQVVAKWKEKVGRMHRREMYMILNSSQNLKSDYSLISPTKFKILSGYTVNMKKPDKWDQGHDLRAINELSTLYIKLKYE